MLTIEENAVVKLIGGPANGFLALIPWTPVPSTTTRASCGPNTDSPRNRAVSQPRNRESEPIQKQGGGARASGPLAGSAAGHLQRPAISSRTICRAFDGTGAVSASFAHASRATSSWAQVNVSAWLVVRKRKGRLYGRVLGIPGLSVSPQLTVC